MSNAALSWARQQRGIPSSARHLLLLLADCANGDDTCWPSQTSLAEEMGLGRQRVSELLALLAKVGLLHQEGTRQRQKYRLSVAPNGHSPVSPTQDTEPEVRAEATLGVVSGRHSVSPGGDTNPKEPSITQKEDSSLRSAAERDPVAEIWSRGVAILGPKRRPLLGKAVKSHGQVAVLEAIVATEGEMPVDPAAFFLGCLARAGPINGKHPGTYRPGPLAAFAEGAFNAARAYNRKHGLDIEDDLPPSFPLLDRQ